MAAEWSPALTEAVGAKPPLALVPPYAPKAPQGSCGSTMSGAPSFFLGALSYNPHPACVFYSESGVLERLGAQNTSHSRLAPPGSAGACILRRFPWRRPRAERRFDAQEAALCFAVIGSSGKRSGRSPTKLRSIGKHVAENKTAGRSGIAVNQARSAKAGRSPSGTYADGRGCGRIGGEALLGVALGIRA